MSLSPENESIAVACRIFFIVFGTLILVALTLIYTGAILQGLNKQIIITHVYLTVEYFSSPTVGLTTEPSAQMTQKYTVRMKESVSSLKT